MSEAIQYPSSTEAIARTVQTAEHESLDFYCGIIVPPQEEGQPEPRHPIALRILGDTTIAFYGFEVDLQDDTLYGFNALLHASEAASADRLSALGLDHNTTTTEFEYTLSNLQVIFNGLAKTDMIGSAVLDGTQVFVLNPNIVITDEREKQSRAAVSKPRLVPRAQPKPLKHEGGTKVKAKPENEQRSAIRATAKKAQRPLALAVDRPLPAERQGHKTAKERLVVYDEDRFATKDSEDMRRERALSDVLAVYRDHPRVALRLAEQSFSPIQTGGSLETLKDYLQFIGQFPVLTAEQEVELFTTIQEGLDTYRSLDDPATMSPEQEALIIDMAVAHQKAELCNLRLAVSIAKRYFGLLNISPIDLIQEANMGVKKAVSRFDYTTGNKFSTYGTWWIRQRIIRSIADKGTLIRMPVHAHEQMGSIRKAKVTLERTLGRKPDISELAAATGIGEATVDLLETMSKEPLSLSQPVSGDDETYTVADAVAHRNVEYVDPTDALAIQESMDKIFGSDVLNNREKAALALAYELPDRLPKEYDPVTANTESTFKQMGAILGVSKSGAQLILQRALKKAQQLGLSEF